MRKKIFTLILMFLLSFSAFCQLDPKQVDSLSQRLLQLGQDTNRVKTLIEIGNSYNKFDAEKAVKFHTEAIELSKKLNYKLGLTRSMTSLSWSYMWGRNYVKSVEIAQEALKMIDSTDILQYWTTKGALALVYKGIGDNDRAKDIYCTLLEIIKRKGLRDNLATLLYLGEIYESENKLDSAFYFAYKGQSFIDNFNRHIEPVFSTGVPRLLGILYDKQNNSDSSYFYFRKAYNIAIQSKSLLSIQDISNSLSKHFQKKNNKDSALFYALRAMEGVDISGNQQAKYEAGLFLAKYYKTINQKDTAYKYLEMAMAAKDSLNSAEKLNQIQALILKEAAQKQEFILKQESLKNSVKQYALLAALVIFSFIALMLYRNNRQKQKANVTLYEQKIEIQNNLKELKFTQSQLIQKEKLASLGELTAGIAHEIQNPLNFVNNFSELSVDLAKELNEEIDKELIDKDLVKDLVADLSSNQEKINHHGKRASSIVKGMLEHSRASTGERELTDINALADEYLRLSYHGMRAKDKNFNADYKTEFDSNLPKINVIPQDIGRVLLNLINNAFYAVKAPQPPKGESFTPSVIVSTQRADNQIIITVKDNGNGIPENIKAKIFQPFFTTKPTGEGTGLGLSLAYDIVTKGHGGELKVETKEGEGSIFQILLPI